MEDTSTFRNTLIKFRNDFSDIKFVVFITNDESM